MGAGTRFSAGDGTSRVAADGKLPLPNNSADQLPKVPLPAHDTEGVFDERGEGPSFPGVDAGASAGGLEAFTQLLKARPVAQIARA